MGVFVVHRVMGEKGPRQARSSYESVNRKEKTGGQGFTGGGCSTERRVQFTATTSPGDGAGKPDEGIAVQLIGPAEAVNDAGNGRVGLRIPHVVGELEILGNGAVLVLSFRGLQIHGCPPR